MKAIKFDTLPEAKAFDAANNSFTGNVTKYKYPVRSLVETVVLTKAEYAEAYGIPATLTDDEGVESANPAYTALDNSYTLNRVALLVGDDLSTFDESGNVSSQPEGLVELLDEEILAGE